MLCMYVIETTPTPLLCYWGAATLLFAFSSFFFFFSQITRIVPRNRNDKTFLKTQ